MDQATRSEWNQFQLEHMRTPPLTVDVIVDDIYNATALIDSGCLCYALVNKRFADRNHLERFSVPPRKIQGIDGQASQITEVVRWTFRMHGHKESAYAYVVDMPGEDVVLGKGWLDHRRVTINLAKKTLYIHSAGVRVRTEEGRKKPSGLQQVSAAAFAALARRKGLSEVRVFAASIADIDKALQPKKKIDVRAMLPSQYQEFYELFNPKEADRLPPHRGLGVDHKIELNLKDAQPP